MNGEVPGGTSIRGRPGDRSLSNASNPNFVANVRARCTDLPGRLPLPPLVAARKALSTGKGVGESCVAVGEMFTPGKQFAFAETWNGTVWKMTKVPEPANTISNLTGVSCTSPKSCVAVDAYNPHALVQSWNGQVWRIVQVPAPASTGPSLSAVTCLTSKFCLATGTHYPSPKYFSAIALSWNGSAWN